MPTEIDQQVQQIAAQLGAAEIELKRRAPEIDKPVAAATVRFQVTKWVLWSYLGYAIAVGLYIMWKGESSQTTQLIDMMKTLLLPIVTLVIGFYFGSKAE